MPSKDARQQVRADGDSKKSHPAHAAAPRRRALELCGFGRSRHAFRADDRPADGVREGNEACPRQLVPHATGYLQLDALFGTPPVADIALVCSAMGASSHDLSRKSCISQAVTDGGRKLDIPSTNVDYFVIPKAVHRNDNIACSDQSQAPGLVEVDRGHVQPRIPARLGAFEAIDRV